MHLPETYRRLNRKQPALHNTSQQNSEAEQLAAQIEAHRTRTGPIPWLWRAAEPLLLFGLLFDLFVYAKLNWTALALLITSVSFHMLCNRLTASQAAFYTQNACLANRSVLAELLHWPNARVRAVARLQLQRLFAGIEPENPLEPQFCTELGRSLSIWEGVLYPDYAAALLLALARMGEQQAAAPARHIARFSPYPRLRRAARLAQLQLFFLQRPANNEEPRNEMCQQQPAAASEKERARHTAASTRYGLRWQFLLAGALVFTPAGLIGCAESIKTGRLWLLLPSSLLAAAPFWMHGITLKRREVGQLRALSASEDRSVVGALADALGWPEPYAQYLARRGLTRLLPRLTSRDVSLLNTTQRAALYRALEPGEAQLHPELALALLKALEQIGDHEALAPVERLAALPAAAPVSSTLKDAARHCLLFLPQAAAENSHEQLLLRASGVENRMEQLLRSAAGSRENPQEMLRASEKEG